MIDATHSEKTLLAAILQDADNWYDASASIGAEDFFLESHQRIWRTAGLMIEDGKGVDEISLAQEMASRNELESIGGYGYIADLMNGVPRRVQIAEHVRRIKKSAQQRRLVKLCEVAQIEAEEKTPEETVGLIESGLEEILNGHNDQAEIAVSLAKTMENIHREHQLTESPGLGYGIPSLDAFTGGMRKGEVTVVGARSGVGKTSLACQALVANGSKGIPVCFFSLEMTKEQIDRRLLSIVSGVPYRHIVDPWKASGDEIQRMSEAANIIAEWPIRVYDGEDMNLARILAVGRIAIRRHKCRLIVCDYAQDVDAPGRDERTKLVLICKKLARLVKHEDCSLILLSQLTKVNRESYGKPPIVGDLMETGKLENVAHCVVLLHRGWDEDRRRIADDAELIIPKQRRGETGVLQAKFSRLTVTFEDVQNQHWMEGR